MKMLILALVGLKILVDREGLEKITESVRDFVPWLALLNVVDSLWGSNND